MFQNYLKIAWRNLLKHKVTGFINIAGLAIGMAVAMMIGFWIHDELTYNTYHKYYDRLAQVYIHQQFNEHRGTGQAISLPCGPGLRNDFGSDFDHIALASWNFEHAFVADNRKFLEKGMFVEPEFIEMFSLDLLHGSYSEALREPNSILINESFARKLFGNDDPVGRTLRMDASYELKVTGVFADLPHNTELNDVHYYLPWSQYEIQNTWVKENLDNWNNHSFQLYVQIAEGRSFEEISSKISDMEIKHNKNGEPSLFLFPMSRWHLYSQFEDGINTGGRIQFVWLFGIIGTFVLLLACINFMNLSTARSEKRAREVGIRKSIGSLRGQLIWQFLSESMMTVILALTLSIALVQVSLKGFNQLADKAVEIPIMNPVFWIALLAFAFLTGILAGSYPAFYLSAFDPLKVLKGTFNAGKKGSLPRQVLVTLQFTVSVALIIGTLIVFQQIQHAKNRPVGYNREGIIQFRVSPEILDKMETFRSELMNTQAVEEVAYSSNPVTEVWSRQIGFDWDGKDPEALPLFNIMACSYEFGRTIHWDILQGRDFSREYTTDTSALVLNEAAVELTGQDDIIGRTIRWNDAPYRVIGVVKNMVMESPWEPIRPTIFVLSLDWINNFTVRLKSGTPIQKALSSIETLYNAFSPSTPFEYQFIDDEYNTKFQSEERIGKLARIFAILAIFISCLGLFGLSAYVAEQRTKEIGIRKVLGASVANLWAMQSKGFLGLVLISCLIAVPISWYFLNGWLSDYEYRIQLGWTTFAVSGFMALAVTLVTVSFQSVKAALANPVDSLKNE